jgi:hypothetical protein
MKALSAILILANVGLYLWATGIEPPEPLRLPPPPVNLQAMRLTQEAAPPRKDATAGAEAAQAAVAATPPPPAPCLRIGPFTQPAEAEALGRELARLKLPFRQNVQGERQLRRWRVYLGPFPDPGAMESRRAELKKAGITDQYVKRDSDGRGILSLGLFSQSALADRYVRELREKGVHPLVRPEDFPLGSIVWIELNDTDANARAAEKLGSLRFPDTKTALRETPCPPR